MTEPQWDQLAELFEAAVALSPEEREVLVCQVASRDGALGEELRSLLESHESPRPLGVEARLADLASGGREAGLAFLTTGTRLGPYQVEELVGEGGMGEVYRATRADGAYHQVVAIKVLRSGYLAAESVRRFRLEREALARLVHPDIAAIHDGGTTPDGRPYLVLQYVDGIPITSFADAHQLSAEARLRLFVRVAEAVHFAHSRLVVHRDLKPTNILVDAEGHPFLLDFGVARLLDPSIDGSLVPGTRPEVRLLTPEHAAPEQLRGEVVGTAADVYALGVLLFELLTGTRPFARSGRTPTELERLVLEAQPPTLASVAPRERMAPLGGDLERIVAMALRKEPDRRYASASQFAEDVGRYLQGLPVIAERDTWGYRARKFVRRNRGGVGVALTIVGLLTVAATTLFVQSRRLAQERDRATGEREAADDLLALLTRLFDKANPVRVPGGDTVRVVTLLQEAERQVDSLAPHPDRQARLRRTLGDIYAQRGEYRRAIALLQPAWEYQRTTGEAVDIDDAELYLLLASTVRNFEGGVRGRAMLDSALAMVRALGDAPAQLRSQALRERALAATSATESAQLMDSVVALQRELGNDSMAIAAALNALASHSSTGRDRGLALFLATERILARLVPDNHPHLRAVRNNVATTYQALGDFARAESLSRALAPPPGAVVSPDQRANDMERMALLAAHRGRLEEAEGGLRLALQLLRTGVGPDHWRVHNSLRNLGLVVALRGRVGEGLALLDSAVAGALASAGLASSTAAYIDGQRIALLLRVGRESDARRTLARVRARLGTAYPPGHYARSDLPFWAGMERMVARDSAGAIREFEEAIQLRRGAFPEAHPKVSEAECALLAAQRQSGEACETYARWGLADPLLLTWVRARHILR